MIYVDSTLNMLYFLLTHGVAMHLQLSSTEYIRQPSHRTPIDQSSTKQGNRATAVFKSDDISVIFIKTISLERSWQSQTSASYGI